MEISSQVPTLRHSQILAKNFIKRAYSIVKIFLHYFLFSSLFCAENSEIRFTLCHYFRCFLHYFQLYFTILLLFVTIFNFLSLFSKCLETSQILIPFWRENKKLLQENYILGAKSIHFSSLVLLFGTRSYLPRAKKQTRDEKCILFCT